MAWSKHGHECCVRCGTADRPHEANGLCDRCYTVRRYHTDRETILRKRKADRFRRTLEATEAAYLREKRWKERNPGRDRMLKNEWSRRHGKWPEGAPVRLTQHGNEIGVIVRGPTKPGRMNLDVQMLRPGGGVLEKVRFKHAQRIDQFPNPDIANGDLYQFKRVGARGHSRRAFVFDSRFGAQGETIYRLRETNHDIYHDVTAATLRADWILVEKNIFGRLFAAGLIELAPYPTNKLRRILHV
jgi:hypothetical protein